MVNLRKAIEVAAASGYRRENSYTLVAPSWEVHYSTAQMMAGRELTEEDKRLVRESTFFGFNFVVQETLVSFVEPLFKEPRRVRVTDNSLYYQKGLRWT